MTGRRRGAAGLNIFTLVVLAALMFAPMAQVVAAQDDATGEDPPATEEAAPAEQDDPPVEEAPTGGADLNPANNRGGNKLNPNVTGTANLNPNVAPRAVSPSANKPAAEANPDEAGGGDEQASGDGAADEREVSTAQAAAQPGRQNQAQEGEAQPVVAAQEADGGGVSGGSGGDADASGAGGTIIQSAGITGNNRGSEINVYDCAYGSVQIDGGTIINATDMTLSANGGTAVTTATGGDDNVVQAGGAVASRMITAGNGGSADAGADGGTIITGAMITGNNRGHEVNFADCPNGRGDAVLILDAGDITNSTTINITADGGTAIADASGGSGNLGVTGGLGDAAAGNGGNADATANGGRIMTSAIITGNNRGHVINVGNPDSAGSGGASGGVGAGGAGCAGVSMVIDGGSIVNETNLNLSADGGTAIADASGGDDNSAFGGDVAAGNGGSADATANGGTIRTDPMITGNNRGNSISVGNVVGCAPAAPQAAAPSGGQQASGPGGSAQPRGAKQVSQPARARGKGAQVVALPSTGAGMVAGAEQRGPLAGYAAVALAVLGAGMAVAARRELAAVRARSR